MLFFFQYLCRTSHFTFLTVLYSFLDAYTPLTQPLPVQPIFLHANLMSFSVALQNKSFAPFNGEKERNVRAKEEGEKGLTAVPSTRVFLFISLTYFLSTSLIYVSVQRLASRLRGFPHLQNPEIDAAIHVLKQNTLGRHKQLEEKGGVGGEEGEEGGGDDGVGGCIGTTQEEQSKKMKEGMMVNKRGFGGEE